MRVDTGDVTSQVRGIPLASGQACLDVVGKEARSLRRDLPDLHMGPWGHQDLEEGSTQGRLDLRIQDDLLVAYRQGQACENLQMNTDFLFFLFMSISCIT